MSKIVLALVGLAQAVGAAATFPHQPVPSSFNDRIVAAVAAVRDAAADPDLAAGGEAAVDLAALADKLLDAADADSLVVHLAAILAKDTALVGAVSAAVPPVDLAALGDHLLDAKASGALVERLAAALAKDTAFVKAVSKDAPKIATDFEGRLKALEDFADKVTEDLGPRLKKLEDAAAAAADEA